MEILVEMEIHGVVDLQKADRVVQDSLPLSDKVDAQDELLHVDEEEQELDDAMRISGRSPGCCSKSETSAV
jgi:hypothetical protein